MSGFLILAGVMIALALAFVLPALLVRRADEPQGIHARANVLTYRDQLAELEADLKAGSLTEAQYDAGRHELERRVMEDTLAAVNAAAPASSQRGDWLAVALSLVIPLGAVALYLTLGTPQALAPQLNTAGSSGQDETSPAVSIGKIRQMVAKLAERVERQPGDGAGWAMLARSYGVLGEFKKASEAYQHAVRLLPGDAQLWADYAYALGMAQGQTLEGEPSHLIEHALTLDPSNVKALALAGAAAFGRKNYSRAVGYWQKAILFAPPDTEFTQSLKASLEDARARAQANPGTRAMPSAMPEGASGPRPPD